MKVTFITGNQAKADFLAKFLGYPVGHEKLDLDELQSLNSEEIVEHKVKQAFKIVNSPVLVEDVSLVINALGRLPGPFIKWFEQELGLEGITSLLNSYNDRTASVSVTYGFYDGTTLKFISDTIPGSIAQKPMHGEQDFGWNPIFIADGSSKTFAQMSDEETEKYSIRTRKIYPELKQFLAQLDKQ